MMSRPLSIICIVAVCCLHSVSADFRAAQKIRKQNANVLEDIRQVFDGVGDSVRTHINTLNENFSNTLLALSFDGPIVDAENACDELNTDLLAFADDKLIKARMRIRALFRNNIAYTLQVLGSAAKLPQFVRALAKIRTALKVLTVQGNATIAVWRACINESGDMFKNRARLINLQAIEGERSDDESQDLWIQNGERSNEQRLRLLQEGIDRYLVNIDLAIQRTLIDDGLAMNVQLLK